MKIYVILYKVIGGNLSRSEKNISCLFWNIQQKNTVETVEKACKQFNPDIIFLAEVESPNRGTVCSLMKERGYECIKWVGDSIYRGLALYAKCGIVDNSYTAGDGEYCIAAKLSGMEECIVGVWSKTEKDKSNRYCEHVQNIFDYHIAKEKNPIFVGDFNASPKVKDQKCKAPRLFKYFKDNGYESLYHMRRGVVVGEEKDSTHKHSCGYFMFDYVLIPASSSDSIDLITDYSSAKDFLNSG